MSALSATQVRGRVLSESEYENLDDPSYVVSFDDKLLQLKRAANDDVMYIDLRQYGNMMRLINDCHEAPNLQLVYWPEHDAARHVLPRRAYLVAKHDIPANVELTWDYGRHYERHWLNARHGTGAGWARPMLGGTDDASSSDEEACGGVEPLSTCIAGLPDAYPPHASMGGTSCADGHAAADGHGGALGCVAAEVVGGGSQDDDGDELLEARSQLLSTEAILPREAVDDSWVDCRCVSSALLRQFWRLVLHAPCTPNPLPSYQSCVDPALQHIVTVDNC